MKTILIVTKEYHHHKISSSGGTGVFYKTLAEKLTNNGLNVIVFGTNKKPISFQENGIQFHFVKDFFKKNKVKEFFRSLTGKFSFTKKVHLNLYIQEKKYIVEELQKLLRNQNTKPDIIETHDWEGVSLFFEQLHIPFVIRCHGSWTVLEREFGYKNVSVGKKYCEKLAFEKSKFNIVISEFSKKINTQYFGIKNPELIYNGIDVDFFKINTSSPIKENSIFFIGNLSKEKGVETALKTFEKVKENIPNASLHFIGNTNDYPKKINQFLSEKNRSSVHFHGQKNRDEIVSLLSQATIVLFPSKGENFSLSLLETMALGKAVICSEIPAFTEIIQHEKNGMIAKNADSFSEFAVQLLKNKQTVFSLGLSARETVVERFSVDKMIAETIKYYQKIDDEF